MASGLALYAKPSTTPRFVPVHPPAAKKPVAKKTAANHPTFERDVLPVIKQYCIDCHSGEDATADLALDKYKNVVSVLKDHRIWESIAQNVAESHMPPRKMPQPSRQQRDRLVQWIESTLSQAFCDIGDPGRVTMRRLNREEYNNTIRDLFHVDFKPAADFPSDDIGYGFDNIGDVLSISPLLMEKYLDAAEAISMKAIVAPDADIRFTRFDGSKLLPDKNTSLTDSGARFLGSHAEVGADYKFPASGAYRLRVRAWAHQAGDGPAKMSLKLDGKELQVFEVKAPEEDAGVYEYRLEVPGGQHRVTLAFTNDFYDETLPEGKRDRNLAIELLEIEGPRLLNPQPTASHKKLLPRPSNGMTPAQQAQYAREVLTKTARRAYRRPVSKAEIDKLAGYVTAAQKEGDSFERGMQIALQAMLVSPHFLFRIEGEPAKGRQLRKLNDFELAARLSYFLWSSTPDESLLWWAAQGKLSEPKHLLHQVRRMLKDPKASSLANNFAMQWLELRRLHDIAPDPEMFPGFTPELRQAMQTETAMFCGEIIRNDRSILDFIDAKFTYLNEPLAKHYGIPNVKGPKFARVILNGDTAKQRGGVLTHASVLTVTSNPTRTSPVKRGKWVLEQIMGAPPPPAPPEIPALSEDKAVISTASLRKRMEQHRKDPSCASCHARMDPIGFGLENYDAIGGWRLKDGQFPVDATGELADGKKFNGPLQLRTILKSNKDKFARALGEKLMIYALGRGLERTDKCVVDALADAAAKNNYRFSSLVMAIVQSEPFRTKRADTTKINTAANTTKQ